MTGQPSCDLWGPGARPRLPPVPRCPPSEERGARTDSTGRQADRAGSPVSQSLLLGECEVLGLRPLTRTGALHSALHARRIPPPPFKRPSGSLPDQSSSSRESGFLVTSIHPPPSRRVRPTIQVCIHRHLHFCPRTWSNLTLKKQTQPPIPFDSHRRPAVLIPTTFFPRRPPPRFPPLCLSLSNRNQHLTCHMTRGRSCK